MNVINFVLAVLSLIIGCALLYYAVVMVEDRATGAIFVGGGIMLVLNGFTMIARQRR